MSPVERRTRSSTTTAVVVALGGVVAGLGLLLFMVNLASQGTESVDINVGDDRFPAGDAAARAESIKEDGPILFADPAQSSRDIYLQHIGDDPENGWLAFAAVPPGKERDCFIQWQADEEHFEDCDGAVYPADGGDLPSYPVTVDDGELVVDINAEFRDEEADAPESADR